MIRIYHNPRCGAPRDALDILRATGQDIQTFVITDKETRLCRPLARIHEIL